VLESRLGHRVKAVLADRFPRAGVVARLGTEAFRRGISVAPEQAVPVYLRDNVARKPALRA
jgi:tRNA threonylcarbamoyladenosine biosynthesis protein TsaB